MAPPDGAPERPAVAVDPAADGLPPEEIGKAKEREILEP